MMVAGRYALDAPARGIAVMRDIDGPVPLRLYDAREQRGPGPILVFIHGGGWVIGGVHPHDPLGLHLALELDPPGVAVDFRLPPQHPSPAALRDPLPATRRVASGAPAHGRTATGP